MPSIGRSIPHESAVGHVTGQALYIDDLTPITGELCVDFVGAPISAGVITSIDWADALRVPGVVGVLNYRDLPGQNRFGAIVQDEPFLVEDEVSLWRATSG